MGSRRLQLPAQQTCLPRQPRQQRRLSPSSSRLGSRELTSPLCPRSWCPTTCGNTYLAWSACTRSETLLLIQCTRSSAACHRIMRVTQIPFLWCASRSCRFCSSLDLVPVLHTGHMVLYITNTSEASSQTRSEAKLGPQWCKHKRHSCCQGVACKMPGIVLCLSCCCALQQPDLLVSARLIGKCLLLYRSSCRQPSLCAGRGGRQSLYCASSRLAIQTSGSWTLRTGCTYISGGL